MLRGNSVGNAGNIVVRYHVNHWSTSDVFSSTVFMGNRIKYSVLFEYSAMLVMQEQ